MAGLTPEAVAEEAGRLRAVLEAGLRHLELSPVSITDGSAAVAAFWNTLGWSKQFANCLERPETSCAEQYLAELLADYRQDKAFTLKRSDFPARLRLVEVDSQGLGFVFADDTTGADDPPLFFVSTDKNKIKPHRGSYLKRCATVLVAHSLTRFYKSWVATKSELHASESRALLPLLAPSVRQVDHGVWVAERDKTGAGFCYTIRHDSVEALVAWLRKTPPDAIYKVWNNFSLDVIDATLADVKDALQLPGGECVVGTLDDTPVLIRKGGRGLTLTVNPRHFRELVPRYTEPGSVRTIRGGHWVREKPALPGPPPAIALEPTAFEALLQRVSSFMAEASAEYRTTREPLDLEPDAPAWTRAFFRVVGRSSLLKKFEQPALEESERELRRVVSRWEEDVYCRDGWRLEPGARLIEHPSFPKRRRLVDVYLPSPPHEHLIAGAYLDLTDETTGADDPPVLELAYGGPRPAWWPRRYVAELVRSCLANAVSGFGPAVEPPADCPEPFLPLVEGFCEVAPGIYFFRDSARYQGTPHVRFTRLRDYVTYAAGVPEQAFYQAPMHGDVVSLALKKKTWPTLAELEQLGLRMVPRRNTSYHFAFGFLDDVPVWLSFQRLGDGSLDRVSLDCSSDDKDRVLSLLESKRDPSPRKH